MYSGFLYSGISSWPWVLFELYVVIFLYNRYYNFVRTVKIVCVLVITVTRCEYERNSHPCMWRAVSTIDSSGHVATRAWRRMLIRDARSESLVIQTLDPSSCSYRPNRRMKNISLGVSGAAQKVISSFLQSVRLPALFVTYTSPTHLRV